MKATLAAFAIFLGFPVAVTAALNTGCGTAAAAQFLQIAQCDERDCTGAIDIDPTNAELYAEDRNETPLERGHDLVAQNIKRLEEILKWHALGMSDKIDQSNFDAAHAQIEQLEPRYSDRPLTHHTQ